MLVLQETLSKDNIGTFNRTPLSRCFRWLPAGSPLGGTVVLAHEGHH